MGFIHIYTGDGKGKTTASIGQIVRAVGHGVKCCLVFFHKDPKDFTYGEFAVLNQIGVELFGFAKKHPHFDKSVDETSIRMECLKGINFIKTLFNTKKYKLIVVDEISISIRDGFLKEDEVLELLDKKPPEIDLILTGRSMPQVLIKKADLVSEVKKIKHPFDLGFGARKGIEY